MEKERKPFFYEDLLQANRLINKLSKDNFAEEYLEDIHKQAHRSLWSMLWVFRDEVDAMTNNQELPNNEDAFFDFLEELPSNFLMQISRSILKYFETYVKKVDSEYRVTSFLRTSKMMAELTNKNYYEEFKLLMLALLRHIPNDFTAGKVMFVDWLIPNFGETHPDLMVAVGKEILAMEQQGAISRKVWEERRLIELYEGYISNH